MPLTMQILVEEISIVQVVSALANAGICLSAKMELVIYRKVNGELTVFLFFN